MTKEGPYFTDYLNVVLRRTSNLKVFIAGGSYDLATPVGYAKKSTEKANFPTGRVIFKEYESGHMLYLGKTGKLFSDDLRSFILSCTNKINYIQNQLIYRVNKNRLKNDL